MMTRCPRCRTSITKDKILCDMCSGAHNRRTYRERTLCLAANLVAAALEEQRVRTVVKRLSAYIERI